MNIYLYPLDKFSAQAADHQHDEQPAAEHAEAIVSRVP